LLLVWHWAQGAVTCAPASGKYVAWLNADFRLHVVSVLRWHVSHAVGKPVCGTGDLALLKSVWWQPRHVVGTPV
jgi:hypothetical protein